MKTSFTLLIVLFFSSFAFSQRVEKNLIGYWKKEIENIPSDAKYTEYYFQFNTDGKGEMGIYQKDWGEYDVFKPDREIASWKLRADTLYIYSYPIDGKQIFRNHTFIVLKMKKGYMEVKDISNSPIMTEAEIERLMAKSSIKYYKIISPRKYLK